APAVTRDAYAVENHVDAAKTWITLMPGSRRKEGRMNLPTMLGAAGRLGGGYEFLLPVARTLDSAFLAALIAGATGARRAASLQRAIHLVPEALPALYHSRAGIVASGTATVEAAIMGTPFVMVYRVSALTYAMGKPRVKAPYFAMVNLIAEEEAVPALVQHKFTVENIVTEMNEIIPDGEPRRRMIERLGAVKARLQGSGGGAHPSETAAEIILKKIKGQ